MKKKCFTLILLFTVLLSIFPNNTFASTVTEIIYQDDELIVTSTLTTYDSPSGIQLFSNTKTKTSSKTVTITDSTGNTVATYTLHATFSYNKKSATCTQTHYSSSIKNNAWGFTARKARKSSNTATGSYTIKNSKSKKTQSSSVRLSCSKNGTIS